MPDKPLPTLDQKHQTVENTATADELINGESADIGLELEEEAPDSREVSAEDFNKQKILLAQDWSKLSGVEMPEDLDFGTMDNEQFEKTLYENLMQGVDAAVKEIGFEIDQDLLEKIANEKDPEEKSALQKQFIEGIIQQTRCEDEGGKFKDRGDKWAYYPKLIAKNRQLNCSGATMIIGRILEKAGFEVGVGAVHRHSVSVAKLADGHNYYVDSRRRNDNLVPLNDEDKPAGEYSYREMNNDRIAFKKVFIIPKQAGDMKVILSNSRVMRESHDAEAQRQTGTINPNIDFGDLAEKLFSKEYELYETEEWQEEAEQVEAKHDIDAQLAKIRGEKFGGLTGDQINSLMEELKKNGDQIYQYCNALSINVETVKLLDGLSDNAKEYAIVTGEVLRNVLENIRSNRADGEESDEYKLALEKYKFALAELKSELSP